MPCLPICAKLNSKGDPTLHLSLWAMKYGISLRHAPLNFPVDSGRQAEMVHACKCHNACMLNAPGANLLSSTCYLQICTEFPLMSGRYTTRKATFKARIDAWCGKAMSNLCDKSNHILQTIAMIGGVICKAKNETCVLADCGPFL